MMTFFLLAMIALVCLGDFLVDKCSLLCNSSAQGSVCASNAACPTVFLRRAQRHLAAVCAATAPSGAHHATACGRAALRVAASRAAGRPIAQPGHHPTLRWTPVLWQ